MEEKNAVQNIDELIKKQTARLNSGASTWSDADPIAQAAMLQNLEKMVGIRAVLVEFYGEADGEAE